MPQTDEPVLSELVGDSLCLQLKFILTI